MKKFLSVFAILSLTASVCLGLIGCNMSEHTHTYSTEWTCDETHHYHACECGAEKDKAEHTFVDEVCSVCGYVEITKGLAYTFNAAAKTYTVTGIGTATVNNLNIPSSYDDGTNGKHPVTSIGDRAFWDCSSLTSITIPNSVTSVGERAFAYCSSLTSITIPNSVTSIGYEAFSRCFGLTSITIPNSVTSIGSSAFYGCSRLTSITIPDSVESIGDEAFYGCSRLTSIAIPDSVESIGNRAFCYCSGLMSITIPDSVTSIGSEAFRDCESLKSVTIPNSVTSIGYSAFGGCGSLKSITVEKGNTKYSSKDGILYNKEKPQFIHIPKGIQGAVTIPNGVTSIRDRAFYNCSGLTSVTIGNSVESIGGEAFRDCSGLTSITYKGTNAQWQAIRKGYSWNNGVPSSCKVHCTDGSLSIR